MNRKHLAERVLDHIDSTRKALEAAIAVPNDLGFEIRAAVDSETEGLELYMEKAWLRIHRLHRIAESMQPAVTQEEADANDL